MGDMDEGKTREQLIKELESLRQQLAELQASVSRYGQIKETLLEERKRFQSISAAAHDAIIVLDSKGTVSYWNKAA